MCGFLKQFLLFIPDLNPSVGPWTRSDRTILAAARPLGFEGDATANPAAWEQDDGSVLFAYRGRHDEVAPLLLYWRRLCCCPLAHTEIYAAVSDGQVQVLPLATAPSWRGPYQRLLRNGSSAFNSSCSTQLCNATICLDRMEAGPGIFNISQRGDPDQVREHSSCGAPWTPRFHLPGHFTVL